VLVSVVGSTWSAGPLEAIYPIYSLTKPVIAAAILDVADSGRLDLAHPAPDGGQGTIRNLLDHTSGTREYGSIPAYHEAVRRAPLEPWTDEAFLEVTGAAGPEFAPGASWGYSNTGYLLLRRVLDAHGGLASFLPRLGLAETTVAEGPADLLPAVPAPSRRIADGVPDVRGRYDPRWVGHRSLVATAGDLLGFWRSLPTALLDPATFIPIGRPAPGFVRPSYGLGVMADPGSPLGTVVGHGGGGPGYAHGVFAVPARDAVAIVMTPDERFDAQGAALRLLEVAIR
jgi:D-alanyl-D-alanine carboxypeptidase